MQKSKKFKKKFNKKIELCILVFINYILNRLYVVHILFVKIIQKHQSNSLFLNFFIYFNINCC